MHSWRAALLPYLEQTALHDSIDWRAFATDRVNESVATTVVSTYVCPSGASPSASINHRDVGVNRDNAEGIYSDHAGGAYVAMADGSVRFLSKSTDIATLARVIGRSDGEQ